MKRLLNYTLKGLFAVLPIIILLWILKIVYDFIANIIDSIFSITQGDFLLPPLSAL